jgi:hypothetical protein
MAKEVILLDPKNMGWSPKVRKAVQEFFHRPPRNNLGGPEHSIMEACSRCEGIFYIRPEDSPLYENPEESMCPRCDRHVLKEAASSQD